MTNVDSDRPDLSGRAGGAALTDLYDTHARDLHRYLARRLDPVVADDLVAETFLVAWEQRARYDPGRGTARSWLFGIATNLLRPPRKLIASAAAAVVLAVGVVAAQAVWSGDNAPVASAAEQLNAAADKADPEQPLKPGQYRYTATHTWKLESRHPKNVRLTWLEESVREEWVSADPTQQCTVRTTVTGNRKWLVGDEEKAKAAGADLPRKQTRQGLASCGHDEPLPTGDAREFYDLLRRGEFRGFIVSSDLDVYQVIAALLRAGITGDERALMYRTLALLPSLKVTEQDANVDGQKGTAYGVGEGGNQHDLIVDPATGRFIGERWVLNTGDIEGIDVPKGTAIDYTSVTGPLTVDKVGATG